jgi:rubredoxin
MKTEDNKCPECKTSWDGGSILETFLKFKAEGRPYYKDKSDEEIKSDMESSYSPPYRWGRAIGIELPYGHPRRYDGVSYWQCPDCKALFDRFTGKKVDSVIDTL